MIKYIIAAVVASIALPSEAAQPAKTKQICKKQRSSTGKEITVCKTIKVHKKYQGTKVPTKKK